MATVATETSEGAKKWLRDDGTAFYHDPGGSFIGESDFREYGRDDRRYRTTYSKGLSSGESGSRVEVIAWYVTEAEAEMSSALVSALEGYAEQVVEVVVRDMPSLASGLPDRPWNVEENEPVEVDELRTATAAGEPQNTVIVDNGKGTTYEYEIDVSQRLAFGDTRS